MPRNPEMEALKQHIEHTYANIKSAENWVTNVPRFILKRN